jgi:ubiquinone/menaquinone biosynthesis C-methylase UbiE
VNLKSFTTPEAVEDYSSYQLDPQEKYLFAKYYRPGDRILDLACGLGRTTLRLYVKMRACYGGLASEYSSAQPSVRLTR